MQDERFEAKIALWLEDAPTRVQRLGRGIAALYHSKIPREFRVLGVLHSLAKTSVASSAPVLAYFYGTLSGGLAAMASAGIFSAHSIVGLLDKLSKEKTAGATDSNPEIMVRFGDLLTALKGRTTAKAPDRDDAIRACLGILEIYARQTTKSKKGEVSVSLVLYVGSSTNKMRIRHRNPGNERPTGREFETKLVIGHYVCQAGNKPRVVDDIRKFGKAGSTSPTQTKVNYRSIYIFPVETAATISARVKGFVSIDCQKPYAFSGNRANDIVVSCEPVINHIRDLI